MLSTLMVDIDFAIRIRALKNVYGKVEAFWNFMFFRVKEEKLMIAMLVFTLTGTASFMKN